jgi:ring-1,2-phenylacetyl-CoA epoxidase subunit PaaD
MVDKQVEIKELYDLLETVKDPEIPVLSVIDLGVVRDIVLHDNGTASITITPTYSGCPAMDTIEKDIKSTLASHGITAEVKTTLSPAWTTDWLTLKGREALEAYGIAPPAERTADKSFLTGKTKAVRCPLCKSTQTTMLSHFGSTACKALYKCDDCLETFDYFKCI